MGCGTVEFGGYILSNVSGQSAASIVRVEDLGNRFPRNIDTSVLHYTVSVHKKKKKTAVLILIILRTSNFINRNSF
jgi:hypothetical protein